MRFSYKSSRHRCSAATRMGLRDDQDEGGCRGERMMPLLFVIGKIHFQFDCRSATLSQHSSVSRTSAVVLTSFQKCWADWN